MGFVQSRPLVLLGLMGRTSADYTAFHMFKTAFAGYQLGGYINVGFLCVSEFHAGITRRNGPRNQTVSRAPYVGHLGFDFFGFFWRGGSP